MYVQQLDGNSMTHHHNFVEKFVSNVLPILSAALEHQAELSLQDAWTVSFSILLRRLAIPVTLCAQLALSKLLIV